jgi:23S rRNA (cytosine1962-C5)-methyltransferase
MTADVLWAPFRQEWILFEDEALIAVDKPAGIPSQAPVPDQPDDVVSRLAAFLTERDGERPYLGVHQRLDQHTSGVMVFAKSRSANPALARQFEGRSVGKEYVAAVAGWQGEGRTLRHRVERARGGAVRVAPGRGGKEAVTHVRVLERRGERALLALRIDTGRTHQIRVQLAHAGAPVAGDVLYGGPRAPRLLLHASALELAHPLTDAPLRIEAPPPSELADWLTGRDALPLAEPGALRAALERAAHVRYGLVRSGSTSAPTTCFRLLHGMAEGLPGLAVDVYGSYLVAHLYEDLQGAGLEAALDVLGSLGFEGVYLKRHPRQANVVVDATAAGLAPTRPVRGLEAPAVFEVLEHGLPFTVSLGDGLGTGLFLDQRESRRRVRELSAGATVLNLFAHTCAFTVAAVAGKARRTVSVDASGAVLERGRAQVLRLDPTGDHRFVRTDVFSFLADAARRGERFDLVVVDPPTYSTTRTSRWRSGTDWRRLAGATLDVTSSGGHVLLCSNDQRLPVRRLRRYAHEAARASGRSLSRLRDVPLPRDFPSPPDSEPHLKCLLAEVV